MQGHLSNKCLVFSNVRKKIKDKEYFLKMYIEYKKMREDCQIFHK